MLAPGSDRIPVELFQILKDYAVKVLHSICNMQYALNMQYAGSRQGEGKGKERLGFKNEVGTIM